MDKYKIKLENEWEIGPQIGDGGFGTVFEASGDVCENAAAKFVPIEPGADRELLFTNLSPSRFRIPILEKGEHDGNYVLVMPRAELSLRTRLAMEPRLTEQEIIQILSDVAMGLSELADEIVHRDIKPGNILYMDGSWRLADFGIARYAQAATSIDTHKHDRTREYAAPEQFRGDRTTHATDVYSLGVVAYEMIQGVLPFVGPDFRDQHINAAAPMPSDCSPSLASLVTACLSKPQPARPTAQNIVDRLSRLAVPMSKAENSLAVANAVVEQRKAEEHARAALIQTGIEARQELGTAATDAIRAIADGLAKRIHDSAPAAAGKQSNMRPASLLNIVLGPAQLIINPITDYPKWAPSHPGQQLFDVVCSSEIYLILPDRQAPASGMGHSLWYCDAEQQGSYRWYEIGFQLSPLSGRATYVHPLPLNPGEDAFFALSKTMHSYDCFWNPLPVDMGNEEQFFERWISWLAAYARGEQPNVEHHKDRHIGRFRDVRM